MFDVLVSSYYYWAKKKALQKGTGGSETRSKGKDCPRKNPQDLRGITAEDWPTRSQGSNRYSQAQADTQRARHRGQAEEEAQGHHILET